MKVDVCGIDYGSKLAGTTSISYLKDGKVELIRSEKKSDADKMIISFCKEFEPELVALDAPLSLPGIYTQIPNCEDYFYRKSDKELQAMSPMFLGGLTARAMKLKSQICSIVIESYPAKRASELELSRFDYKKKNADYEGMLNVLDFDLKDEIRSSHDFDALLCLEIAIRYSKGQASYSGDENEGLIYY